MKNWKTLATGFAAGAACMLTVSAVADNGTVPAGVMADVFFNVDGQVVAPPSDQPVLNYADRVYVPIRFAAELAKATVDWDVANRKVAITTPEPQVVEKVVEKIVEKPVYIDSGTDSGGNYVYRKFPASQLTEDYEFYVTGLTRKPNQGISSLYIKMINLSDDTPKRKTIGIVQRDVKVTIDGKEYPMSKVIGDWDDKWFDTFDYTNDRDNPVTGQLALNITPEEWEKMDISIPFTVDDGSKKATEVLEFHVLNK